MKGPVQTLVKCFGITHLEHACGAEREQISSNHINYAILLNKNGIG